MKTRRETLRAWSLCLTLVGFGSVAAGVSFAGRVSVAAAQHEGGAEHGEAAEHGAHGHEGGIDPIAMGGSVLNFLVLVGLIYVGLRKPLESFLAIRRASVVDGMEEARRVKAAAEAKDAEYTARIANLDAELEGLREDMRRGGLLERDRIVAEASKRAEKMHEDARFLIEQQLKQLREDLTKEAVEAAVRAADETLRKAITSHDQERLAQQYLGTLRSTLQRQSGESRQ